MVLSGISSVQAGNGKKGLCEGDCDKDKDCKGKLLCADAHKKELKAAGFNPRKANCPLGKNKNSKMEVCFDPKILKKTSFGGGGKFHLSLSDTSSGWREKLQSLIHCSAFSFPSSQIHTLKHMMAQRIVTTVNAI